MADANTNPFGAILTPDSLKAQRQAEADKRAGGDPWLQLAGDAGITARGVFAGLGLGDANDREAATNDAIMKKAQSNYADLVKNGTMTADEAQAKVLEGAISDFAANGNYEQALALTQPLNTLRQQSLERNKLRAEASALDAKPALMDAQAQAKIAEIAQKDQALSIKQQQIEALIANNASIQDINRQKLELAAQRLELDRLKAEQAAAKQGAMDPSSVFYQKKKFETDDHVLAAAQATDLMTTMQKVARANPAAMTDVGAWSSWTAGLAASARAAMGDNNIDLDAQDQAALSTITKNNITDAKLQSAAIDLAYAFARVRDPGGRLSNQDVSMAVQIVQGKGDPRAMMATLQQNYRKMVKDTVNYVRVRQGQGIKISEDALGVMQQAMVDYANTTHQPPENPLGVAPAGYGSSPNPPAAAGAAPAAAAPGQSVWKIVGSRPAQ
jgi:hypothetical protein